MSDVVLLLDVGNSACKWVCRGAGTVKQGRVGRESLARTLVTALGNTLAEAYVLISSVAAKDAQEAMAAELAPLCADLWFARPRADLDGLVNSYEDPQRMGVDRWLAMLAARRRCADRVCVVDAGSALTIDLVAATGIHEGGYIIPGTTLMERALFADTDRVRDSLPASTSIAPGCSTAEAVSHGLLLAQAGAVELALATASMRGPRPRLLLCGGGAGPLRAVLSAEHAYVPQLIFEGLLAQAELELPGLRINARDFFPPAGADQ